MTNNYNELYQPVEMPIPPADDDPYCRIGDNMTYESWNAMFETEPISPAMEEALSAIARTQAEQELAEVESSMVQLRVTLEAVQPLESADSLSPLSHPPQSGAHSQTAESSGASHGSGVLDSPAKKNIDVKFIEVDGKSYGLIEVRPISTEQQIELIIKGLKSSMRTRGQRQAIDEFVRPSIERHGFQ